MSEETSGDGGGQNEAAVLPLVVNAQYVKDLSFENPRAPMSLQQSEEAPRIDVNVDVQATRLGETNYEVILALTATANSGDDKVFLVELSYGGLFTLGGIPEEHIQPVLLIECPRLLFPFARAVIADMTRDGGFAPLMIQPVDFAEMYRRSQQPPQEAPVENAPAGDTPAGDAPTGDALAGDPQGNA